jgi:hypothetical protein
MRQSHYTAAQPGIDHPPCPKCGTHMWLARIEPDKPGHDLRRFECPACNDSICIEVKYK